MNLFAKFEAALTLTTFLEKYGSAAHQARWKSSYERFLLNDAQKTLLGSFTRKMNILVLAGAWCGDCSGQCPILTRFAEAAPGISVKYLDRDEHADVQAHLQINGGNRVPVAVFFSEDGYEVSRFGERTLSQYRSMMALHSGDSCGTGISAKGDPLPDQILQDWLNEVERVQYVLRLSGRLRKLHGD